MHARAAAATPYEIATDRQLNPLDELLRAADLANRAAPSDVSRLADLLRHRDSAVRWWAALGLSSLRAKSPAALASLRSALDDASPDVRIVAGEALVAAGQPEAGLPALERALRDDSVFTRLAALQAAGRLGPRARPLLPTLRQAALRDPAHKDISDYVGRMIDYLPEQISQ
jgi:HEAT repeat protein